MSRSVSTRHRDDHGAAAVEFALVWVVLAVLLLGLVQFGTVFSQWLQLGHAAREGARWGALRNPVSSVTARARAAAPFAAGANVVVTPDPIGTRPGDPVTVTVSRRVATPLVAAFPGGDLVLTARATMRAE